MGIPDGTRGKEPACQSRRYETWDRSLGREDASQEEMTTWTERPDLHGVTRVGPN